MKTEITYKTTERHSDIYEIKIPQPNTKYLEQFWKLNCVPLIHDLKLFPKIKEITETMAVFRSLLQWKYVSPKDESVICICPGDGFVPRTAAFLSIVTRWRVVSIDPFMAKNRERVDDIVNRLDRLAVIEKRVQDIFEGEIREKVQNLSERSVDEESKVILISVHSHAPLKKSCDLVMKDLNGKLDYVVSMPCCFEDDLGVFPFKSYFDGGVMSPQSQINLYRDLML